MKSRSSGYSSDSEQTKQQDLSLLRKPISTSLNGFLEVKRAFENGTEEIRRLLSRECDIIYECKLCRNIFRSLTNFLSHKRVYCRETFNCLMNFDSSNRKNFIDQDISTIIQAEEDYVNNKTSQILIKENSNSSSNSIVGVASGSTANNKPNKDLSSIIDRLINREQENRLIKLNDFYDQVDNKLAKEDTLKKNHTLQLDRVPNSNIAVYQTIKKNDNDNIKTEVIEVNNLLNINTVLGPDGKVLAQESADEVDEKNEEGIKTTKEENAIICEVCNKSFLTEKTLILHLQTKHISSTYVYQCPSCSQTFLHPNSVIRHLSNDHKKSMRRIRQMRETIYKRHMRMDAVQMKPQNRELARLQTFEERNAANTKAWMDNIERSPKLSPICTFCGKKFERKAVLNSHLNSCIAKNRQTPPITTVKRDINQLPQTNDASQSQNNLNINSSSCTNNQIVKTADKTNESLETNTENFVEPIIVETKTRKRRKKIKLIKEGPDINPTENLPKLSNKLIKEIIKSEPANDEAQFLISPKISETSTALNKSNDDLDIKPFDEKENSFLKDDDAESTVVPKKTSKKLSKRERLLRLIGSARGLSRKAEKDFTYQCRICKKMFDALSNLRRHISMFHYRRRRFGCKCCGYRAFRKYDVINHLNSFHLLTTMNETDLQDYILVAENNNLKDVDEDIIVSEATLVVTKEDEVAESSEPKRPKSTFKFAKSSPESSAETAEASDNINATLPNDEIVERTKDRKARSIDGIKTKTFGGVVKRPKLTRSSSNNFNKNEDTPKRPIRNRVKPVKKDFVYDLSHLLKKDAASDIGDQALPTEIPYPYPRIRRRNTVVGNDHESFSASSSPTKHNFDANGKQIEKILIKGSAQLMAKMAVARYRACFNTPPEIPTERPIIPSKILAQGRTDNENEEIILNLNDNEETSVLIPNSAKFKGFDEMKKFKNSNHEVSTLLNNRKRCFDISSLTDDSPSTRLLRNINGIGSVTDSNSSSSDWTKKSMNVSANIDSKATSGAMSDDSSNVTTNTEKILVKCATNKEFQEYLIRNKLTEQVKSMNINQDDNSTNKINNLEIYASINSQQNDRGISQQSKRITLLQRLAENQNRKKIKESMLKNALEH